MEISDDDVRMKDRVLVSSGTSRDMIKCKAAEEPEADHSKLGDITLRAELKTDEQSSTPTERVAADQEEIGGEEKFEITATEPTPVDGTQSNRSPEPLLTIASSLNDSKNVKVGFDVRNEKAG